MLHRPAQPHNCDVASLTFAGPIGYAAFVLPRDADAAPALQGLLDRIDAGTIELLDLEILALGAHGAAGLRERLARRTRRAGVVAARRRLAALLAALDVPD